MVEVSIVIVSYNARDHLARCLESLHDSPPDASHEIIVVDNHSSDGSPEVARRWPDVHLVEAGTNLGFARATNIGIRTSTGRSLLLLNSDTIVPAGAIDRLVAVLQAHADVAAVGPRLVNGGGRIELSFGRMLSPFNELRQKLLGRLYAEGFPAASRAVQRAAHREHDPDWVSGACLLVRRADAEAVGLLDERYFMYAEDVDFCAAIRQRGRRILFTPEAEVVHLGGRSAAAAPAATSRAYRLSQIAFYEKHHPRWAPLLRAYLRIRRQI
jgi:GT2 family glycosyltransferase